MRCKPLGAFVFVSILLAGTVSSNAAAPTLEQVIARHVEARGGLAKLRSITSVRMIGKMEMGSRQAPLTILLKRPLRLRSEFTMQGLTAVQAFDGREGWSISPFRGKKDPEPLSRDDAKSLEQQADFDGPLVDFREKGHNVELIGLDKVEGTDAYKLRVTLKDGDVRTLYLDAESFLLIKEEGKLKVRDSVREFEATVGDYKDVGGLMLAFSREAAIKGSPQKQRTSIDKIELNPPLDDALFRMPAAPLTAARSPEALEPQPTKPEPAAEQTPKPEVPKK